MFLEELIKFDKEKLKAVPSLEERIVLIEDFFHKNPGINEVKLNFLITLLKERQTEERPYTYPILYYTVSLCLIISGVDLLIYPFNSASYGHIKLDVQHASIVFFIVWLGLTAWNIYSRNHNKYQCLIRVLESYYLQHELAK